MLWLVRLLLVTAHPLCLPMVCISFPSVWFIPRQSGICKRCDKHALNDDPAVENIPCVLRHVNARAIHPTEDETKRKKRRARARARERDNKHTRRRANNNNSIRYNTNRKSESNQVWNQRERERERERVVHDGVRPRVHDAAAGAFEGHL